MTDSPTTRSDQPATRPAAVTRLQIGGTPFGAWPVVGEAIAAAIRTAGRATGQPESSDGAAQVRQWQVDTPVEPVEQRRAPAVGGLRWLIFVESPATAVARALAAELQALGPGARLPASAQERAARAWREGAARWVRHTHSRRQHCLLVDTREALANPSGLATVLAGWLDLKLDALAVPAPAPHDPLLEMLAGAAMAADRRAADLHDELLASCQPLPDQPSQPDAATPDASASLARFLQLSLLESAQPLVSTERQQLLEDLHRAHLALERATAEAASGNESAKQAQAALKAQGDALNAEAAAHADARARLEAALDAGTKLQHELQQHQAELESTRRRESRTVDALRVSETHVRAARQESLALREAHAGATASLQSARDELRASTEAAARQQAALAEALASLAELQTREQQARARAEEMERGLTALTQDQRALQEAHTLALANLSATQAAAAQWQAEQAQTSRSLNAAEQQLSAAQAKSTEQARELELLTAALSRQAGQAASLLTHARAESSGLMLQLARLEERHLALATEERMAREQVSALRIQLSAAEEAKGHTEAAWARDRTQLRELQQQFVAVEQALAHHQHRSHELERELEELKLQAAAHGRDLEQVETEWRGQLARLSGGLRASLASALKGQEELALRLYEVQHAESALSGAPRQVAGTTGALPGVLAEGQQIVRVHDEAPHRELLVQLENVRVRGLSMPRLALKLVEHEGRPGMVLLADPGCPVQGLAQWQPTGTEDGRELMLLVPGDREGRDRLQRLGSTDWRTVLALAERLRAVAEAPGVPIDRHWPVIAARLQSQLLGQRPRLRYDGLDVQASSDESGGLEFRLQEPWFGDRPWPPVCVRWRPVARQDQLDLFLPGTACQTAPLGSWPVASDGTLETTFPLPVGAGSAARARLGWWSRLPDQDRELVLALLDTLPAAIERAEGRLPAGLTAPALRQQAQALQRQARRSILAGRIGLGAYRALRRSRTT